MSILGFVPKTGFRGFAVSFAATLLASTCAASATTLTYTLGTITGTGLTILTPSDAAGYGVAGQIHLTTADGTINAWCVDLPDDFVQTGATYFEGSSSTLTGAPGVPPLTSDQIGKMGALAVFGDYLVAHPPGSLTPDEIAAAIQIAMWDVEYGATFTYDPLGAPIDGPPPGTSGLVGEYLADVGTGNPWGVYTGFTVLYTDETVNDQTLIWAAPGVHTTGGSPEPSTWAMMLLGFAGLGFAGYRRVQAKPALAQQ